MTHHGIVYFRSGSSCGGEVTQFRAPDSAPMEGRARQ